MASYIPLLFLSALFLSAQSFNANMNKDLSVANILPEESQAPCVPSRFGKLRLSKGTAKPCGAAGSGRVQISYTIFIGFGKCLKLFFQKDQPCRIKRRALRRLRRTQLCLRESLKMCAKKSVLGVGKEACAESVVQDCCPRSDITRLP